MYELCITNKVNYINNGYPVERFFTIIKMVQTASLHCTQCVKGLSQITPGARTVSKIMTQIVVFTRRTGLGNDL